MKRGDRVRSLVDINLLDIRPGHKGTVLAAYSDGWVHVRFHPEKHAAMRAPELEPIIDINITTVEGSDGIAGNHHYVVVDLHETNGLPIRVAQSYPNEDSWDIESNQAVLELYEGRWEWL